jgi:hypothetical protein
LFPYKAKEDVPIDLIMTVLATPSTDFSHSLVRRQNQDYSFLQSLSEEGRLISLI